MCHRKCRHSPKSAPTSPGFARNFAAESRASATPAAIATDLPALQPQTATSIGVDHDERADLRDFNDAVVHGGNLPMDVLAENVADYVRGVGRSRLGATAAM